MEKRSQSQRIKTKKSGLDLLTKEWRDEHGQAGGRGRGRVFRGEGGGEPEKLGEEWGLVVVGLGW